MFVPGIRQLEVEADVEFGDCTRRLKVRRAWIRSATTYVVISNYKMDYDKNEKIKVSGVEKQLELFNIIRRSSGNDLETRLESASKLGQLKSDGRYLSLIISNDYSINDFQDWPKELGLGDSIMKYEWAVIAFAMKNTRDDAPKSVLYSLTTRLKDTNHGEYSRKEGIFPFIKKVSCGTDPLCDIAREKLVMALKVDHGYNIAKWRQEIINK